MLITPRSITGASGCRHIPGSWMIPITLPMIAFLLVGCTLPGNPGAGRDTCTQGENMTDPRLVAGLEGTEGEARIRITWDQGTGVGAQLPPAYFQAVGLSTPSEYVSSVALTAEREITVEFDDLTELLVAGKPLELSLIFPDRRAFIACSHAGMDDRYYLNITLQFSSEGALEQVKFEQGIHYGPI